MQSVQTNCRKEGVAYVLATISIMSTAIFTLHESEFFCIESAQTADATEGVGHVL